MSDDPLVCLGREASRPLHYRPWQVLSAAEQARTRWLLIDELWMIDAHPRHLRPSHWRQTHRELLELKAASGHEPPVGQDGA